ncbi:MAG: DegT/DnrJ/EryC1/StrS family aminotransferase [Solirubrobacteraceae bacterium]|jgi:dTDP-4-amino-4,6-dideoxygalactose transaminase
MADWVVPLSDVIFSEAEVQAVAETYRAGWLSQGAKVAAFEAAFAAHLGSPHAIAVSSGTAALHLICAASALRAGDEVVVPSMTFAATAAVVVQSGATPVFADIGAPTRPWLSVDQVRAAIGPRTRAIINVAYGGDPGEAGALRALADARGLLLIEDAAHGLGAALGERPAGTFGHAGAFSFFANKNLPLGEGGMVVTADAELANRMRLLRSHGLSAGTWARHTGAAADYEVLMPGFNYRLDEPRAALGLLLLKRLQRDNDARARIAAAYASALQEIDRVRPVLDTSPATRGAWHIYPLLLGPGVDRARFRHHLAAAGVQTSIHYPPLHLTPAFAGWSTHELPVTADYGRRTVTVPLFAHLTKAQHSHVIMSIAAALRA